MRELELIFENSPWFILLCLVAGGIYAFLLYQKKSPWGKNLNMALAFVRFTLVFFIAFLLLGPYLKQLKNYIEDPTIVFAIDNSLSVIESSDSTVVYGVMGELDQIKAKLRRAGFNSETYTFEGPVKEGLNNIAFDYRSTNLNQMFSNIQSDFEGRKLAGVVLLSDGIYNLGVSPAFKPFNFHIFSVGIGDTLPKADINMRALYYNKIAYEGNKFPLVAELIHHGFSNETVGVEILHNNQVIDRKSVRLEKDDQVQRVEFLLDANNQGMQHYVVKVEEKPDEYTFVNNQQHAFIDIIEGKQKILMVAESPHPDIKAIRSALETNQNYELEVFIPGLSGNEQQVLSAGEQNFDLVIFHQLPNRQNRLSNVIDHFQEMNMPVWFIAGNQTDFMRLQSTDRAIRISGLSNQKDHVSPILNDNFTRFHLSEEAASVLGGFPPVTIPFGRWELGGSTETILHQRIGNISTDRPLLLVNEDNGRKTAIFIGEGIWRWRLHEYARTENHKIFDELVTKLVQFLASKEDKRKFRVYPLKNEYYDTEQVVFETEAYNDIFERIYGHEVELEITDEQNEKRSFSYVTNQNNTRYRISGLEQGVYKYSASTEINREKLTSEGEFTIQQLQIESTNLMANYDLLRSLARQTNGNFYQAHQLQMLEEDLMNRELQGLIHSSEEFLPIINMSWIFFLLLALISVEWFTRRYFNSY
jgi:hypothetical protein